MKKIILLALLLVATMVGARNYKGTTTTHIMGKTEVKNDLVLQVSDGGSERQVSLNGYSVLSFKNISITGKVTLDKNGEIQSVRDVVIKGGPAKVKTVKGTITATAARITLEGKAGGLFNFDVLYQGK